MRPARDHRMRLIFICSQGHIITRPTGVPDFCEACHPDFDWTSLADEVPVDECRQLFTADVSKIRQPSPL